jgi:hypothetical protein
MTITTDVNSSGLQPTSPTVLQQELIALVSATNPGYTANLPGSLIEDISSTDVGALSLIDSARVELFNSITPYSANSFILNQLGQIYGVQQGIGSNTSVYVVFSGTPGFVISRGFVVSDGTYQYTVQDGGIVETAGQSVSLYCLANNAGSWAVPIGTVTQIITSIPSGVSLTVTNPTTGLPGATAQPLEDYQAQVIQAGLAVASGMPTFLKTQLANVSGVQRRLIAVRVASTNLWNIIVGGGDPYAVGNAIFTGLFDISSIVGSTLTATAITNASNGVVTTDLTHGYSTGQVIVIADSNPSAFNGTYTITVLTPNTFQLNANTSSSGSYVGGAVITPNVRNVTVSINDYPDSYNITFINPLQQTVSVNLLWNTTSTNYVSPTAVAQLGNPAIVNYINSIYVGQPINVFELQNVFQNAIVTIIPPQLLSRMVFTVYINGYEVSPDSGTGLIYGDPESYFETNTASVIIAQG